MYKNECLDPYWLSDPLTRLPLVHRIQRLRRRSTQTRIRSVKVTLTCGGGEGGYGSGRKGKEGLGEGREGGRGLWWGGGMIWGGWDWGRKERGAGYSYTSFICCVFNGV